MPILLTLPGLAAFFWSMMLFFKKKRLGAHKIMAVGLLIYVVAYVLFCMLFAPWSGMPVCLAYILAALLVPFAHFLFFKKVADVGKSKRLPYFFASLNYTTVIVMATLTCLAGPEMDDAFFHCVVMGENIEVPEQFSSAPLWGAMEFVAFKVFNAQLALSGTFVLIWAFIKIIKYDRLLDDYFSDKEEREKKNNLLVFLSAIFGVVPMVLLLAQPFYVIRDNTSLLVICLSLGAIAVFMVGFYSYRIEFTAEQLRFMIDEDNEKRKLADDLPKDDANAIGAIFNESLGRLQQAMEVEKVYLDPELTLIGLSDKLKTNRTYLSKIINLNYNCTFSEYINNHRIDHALTIIQERQRQGVPLKDMATECGYANQASFIRNFSKIVGMTPGEYITSTIHED